MESQSVFQAKTQAKIVSIEPGPWGLIQLKQFWLEFWLEKWLEFWLEIVFAIESGP